MMSAEVTAGLAIVIGAATPPGRLALAARTLGELARSDHPGTTVTLVDLAATPVETCDGRADDAYGMFTRSVVRTISAAHAVIVAAPVCRASYPRRAEKPA